MVRLVVRYLVADVGNIVTYPLHYPSAMFYYSLCTDYVGTYMSMNDFVFNDTAATATLPNVLLNLSTIKHLFGR